MDDADGRLLNEAQERFPLVRAPYAELAMRVGLSEDDALRRLWRMRDEGVIRTVRPIFETAALGYESSLVAMRLPPERLDEAASPVSAHPGVTHNYAREHAFNLWFTIATPPGSDLRTHVEALHEQCGATSTRILPALRTYKVAFKLDMTGERGIDYRAETAPPPRERATETRPLTAREIDVVRELQGGLSVEPLPFDARAARLSMEPEDLLAVLRDFERRGVLRRFAAVLRHRNAGFTANGMAVWDVPDERVDDVGEAMAEYGAISHCYRRPRHPDWSYNLFTMIHARDRAECEAFVRQLAEQFRIERYDVLFSVREYKKTSLVYFSDDIAAWERDRALRSASESRT